MSFKEFAQKDMTTFFNQDEFSQEAVIEGETVPIIIDNETLIERQLADKLEGLHKEELLFYVKKQELSFFPRSDNVVRIDDDRWKITQVQEDLGLFTITAEWVSG